jgi:hypothetical protein
MRTLIASLPILSHGARSRISRRRAAFGSAELSPLVQWLLFLSLGLVSLWSALSHAVFTDVVAKSIGWAPSPFQYEIAGANLGIGLGAIAASVLGVQAAWAMLVMAASFLWSAAAVHIADMVRNKNFAINNAGPIFWWDILTPLTLLIANLSPVPQPPLL